MNPKPVISMQMMRMDILEGITDSILISWKKPHLGSLLRIPFPGTHPLSQPLPPPSSSSPWKPDSFRAPISSRSHMITHDGTWGGCLTPSQAQPPPRRLTQDWKWEDAVLDCGNRGKINSAATSGLSSPREEKKKVKYKRAVGRKKKQTQK